MFLSEGSQAVFARPGQCRLNAVTITLVGRQLQNREKQKKRDFNVLLTVHLSNM